MYRRILAFAAAAVLGVNAVAFAHAWRFTHFVEGGEHTANPETLGAVERAWVLLTGVRVPRPTEAPIPPGFEEERVGEVATWSAPGKGIGEVFLFHGYGGSRSDLVGDAAYFRSLGYGVVLVAFPGSGGSAGNVTSLGWNEAEVVRAVTAHRPKRGSRVLFGKSMGSAAVLRAVGALGVEADALVLENPFDRLVTTVGHRFEAMGLPAFPGAQLLVFWGGVQLGYDGFAWAPVEDARNVKVPTLILHGEQDPRVHVPEVEAIAGAIPAAHQVELFPGTGHVGLRTADPARWEGAIGDWVSSLPAR